MSKQTTLIDAIIALFKADDSARITKFFARERKFYEREIKKAKNNLNTDKLQYEIDIENYKDAVEDAKDFLVNARLNVNPENITSNSEMDEYGILYRKSIKQAKENLKNAELLLEQYKLKYEAQYIKDKKALKELETELESRGTEFKIN